MDFKFSFHQIPHSEFIVNAVETKIGRSLKYIFGDSQVKVAVGKKGYEFSIGVTLNGRAGICYKASAKAENLYAAIDLVQDKLERQFKKNRKKLQNHKRPTLSKAGRMKLLDEGLGMDFSSYKRRVSKKAA